MRYVDVMLLCKMNPPCPRYEDANQIPSRDVRMINPKKKKKHLQSPRDIYHACAIANAGNDCACPVPDDDCNASEKNHWPSYVQQVPQSK